MRALVQRVIVAGVVMFTGCNSQRALESSIPARTPDITGTITNVQPAAGASTRNVVLVEENPGDLQSGGAKASITVSAATRVLESGGGELRTIAFAGLRTGLRAKAWFDGPVAESYPVQGTAGVIVVERP